MVKLKDAKYNTLSKVEKKYCELTRGAFDFGGFDTEEFFELKKSVYIIFYHNLHRSENSIKKMLSGKENRMKAFDAFKNKKLPPDEFIKIFFSCI